MNAGNPTEMNAGNPTLFHSRLHGPALVGLALCLFVTLSACVADEGPLIPPPAQVAAPGDYVHEGTGIVFPEVVGDFQRVDVTEFDDSRSGVSVGYNPSDPDDPIILTIFVYPDQEILSIGSVPDAVEQGLDALAFDSAKAEISAVSPWLTFVRDDEVVLANPYEHTGLRATYEASDESGGGADKLVSELYLFGIGDWLVKYRVAYVESPEAVVRVRDFMEALHLPTV
jgi:hypothetical protein